MSLPAPAAGERFDAVYRIAAPYDLSPSPSSDRTVVFCTAEFGNVPAIYMSGRRPLSEAHRNNPTIITTASNWSREGFLHAGAAAERVVVVPHGVDPKIFAPLDEAQRAEARRKLGWDGFIFLTVGSATPNKGMDLLFKAIAAIVGTHRQVQLVVKGIDVIYNSDKKIQQAAEKLTQQEIARLDSRVHYRGGVGSLVEMATLYQLADAYVAPYRAEGFGLPVLEAIACGLPVICTAGGATDDFVRDDFALRISSKLVHLQSYDEPGIQLEPNLDHLIELMKRVIEQPEIARRARTAGPEFVRANYTWRHAVDKLMPLLFPQT